MKQKIVFYLFLLIGIISLNASCDKDDPSYLQCFEGFLIFSMAKKYWVMNLNPDYAECGEF